MAHTRQSLPSACKSQTPSCLQDTRRYVCISLKSDEEIWVLNMNNLIFLSFILHVLRFIVVHCSHYFSSDNNIFNMYILHLLILNDPKYSFLFVYFQGEDACVARMQWMHHLHTLSSACWQCSPAQVVPQCWVSFTWTAHIIGSSAGQNFTHTCLYHGKSTFQWLIAFCLPAFLPCVHIFSLECYVIGFYIIYK